MGIWFVYSFFLYVHHLNLHVCPSVPAILFGYTYQIVVAAVMTVTMPFCHHLTTTCSVYMNEAKEWFALLFTFRFWCNCFVVFQHLFSLLYGVLRNVINSTAFTTVDGHCPKQSEYISTMNKLYPDCVVSLCGIPVFTALIVSYFSKTIV